MSKLTTFISTLVKSLTNPGYYSDILSASFSFSLRYMFALLFFIALIRGVVFSLVFISVIPKIPGYIEDGKRIARDLYPPGLTVTIKDGSLRSNVDEPYSIPFPAQFNIKGMSLLVIDTKASVDSFKTYHTAFLITRNALAYPDSDTRGSYRVYPFSNLKGFIIINRGVYDRAMNAILPYLRYYPLALAGIFAFLIFVIPVFGSLLSLLVTLIYLVILTLCTRLVAKVMKLNLSYSQVYRLGMHGLTFSLIFGLFKSLTGVSIPYTYTAPFLLWMFIVFNQFKNKDETKFPSAKSA
jgi:hypothetical protein